MLHCTVLRFVVLYCTALSYTVQYYAVLCCVMPSCNVLFLTDTIAYSSIEWSEVESNTLAEESREEREKEDQ